MNYIKKYWLYIVIIFVFCAYTKPAFCFIIFGSIVFYVSISAILFLKKVQNKGIECIGRILSFQAYGYGSKVPIVEFTPIGGGLITEKPVLYASTDLSIIRSYNEMIDKQVLILYHPDEPKKFILADESSFNYIVFAVFILFSVAVVVFGICGLCGYIKLH